MLKRSGSGYDFIGIVESETFVGSVECLVGGGVLGNAQGHARPHEVIGWHSIIPSLIYRYSRVIPLNPSGFHCPVFDATGRTRSERRIVS